MENEEEKTEIESIESKPTSNGPIDLFGDLDIVSRAITLASKAAKKSRAGDFKRISLSYEEIELINRVLVAARDRTTQLNALAQSINNRQDNLKGHLDKIQGALDTSFLELKNFLENTKIKVSK